MAQKGEGEPDHFRNEHMLLGFQNRGFTLFFRAKHRLFGSQGSTRVLCKLGLVVLLRALYTLRQSGGMGKEPFHDSSWLFYSHAPGCWQPIHFFNCSLKKAAYTPCGSNDESSSHCASRHLSHPCDNCNLVSI
jgi:hypothetical protein